jgi:hypothetical protein
MSKIVTKSAKNQIVDWSTSMIVSMIDMKSIDLDPDYQRGYVWDHKLKVRFIDSILDHVYIPPIIVNKRCINEEEDDYQYICIDGKQRIMTLYDFVKDNIKIERGGKVLTFSNLSTSDRNHIMTTCYFKVVTFENISMDEERKTFKVIQNAKKLSKAQKLNSSNVTLSMVVDFILNKLDLSSVFNVIKIGNDKVKDFRYTIAKSIIFMSNPFSMDYKDFNEDKMNTYTFDQSVIDYISTNNNNNNNMKVDMNDKIKKVIRMKEVFKVFEEVVKSGALTNISSTIQLKTTKSVIPYTSSDLIATIAYIKFVIDDIEKNNLGTINDALPNIITMIKRIYSLISIKKRLVREEKEKNRKYKDDFIATNTDYSAIEQKLRMFFIVSMFPHERDEVILQRFNTCQLCYTCLMLTANDQFTSSKKNTCNKH